jgi:hypothetical protein
MVNRRVENIDEESVLITQNEHALYGHRGSGHHCVVAQHLQIDLDGIYPQY